MEEPLLKSKVIDSLWNAYKKTPEYRSGAVHAIVGNHPLVEKQENEGLKLIYIQFVNNLYKTSNIVEDMKKKTIGDQIAEWKNMHKLLFKYVFKDTGSLRTEPVRFGDPGDEDLYRIPKPKDVHKELSALALQLNKMLNRKPAGLNTIYENLAKVHYQFIRIHPFKDGNGRIGRAITDQMAIFYGLPVAMGGFPRHTLPIRQTYHKAIRDCVDDARCSLLAKWIQSFIERQLERIA